MFGRLAQNPFSCSNRFAKKFSIPHFACQAQCRVTVYPVRFLFGRGGSGSDSNIKVVPYRLSPDEARSKFARHHGGWLTSARSLEDLKMEKLAIPFWIVRSDVRVYLSTAHLGFHYWTTEFDFHRKRYERVRKVRWEPRDFDNAYMHTRTLDGTEKRAQVYASFRFRKEYVEGIRSPSLWKDSIPLSQWQAPADVGLDPFQMPREFALNRAIQEITRQEELKVEGMLKESTGADEVRGVRLRLELSGPEGGRPSVDPVYVASYVFSGTYRNVSLRTFVNASTGEVGGQTMPDPLRVGFVAGSAWSVIGAITGGLFSAGGVFWWFLVPAAVASIAARYWPVLLAAYYEAKRVADEQRANLFAQQQRGATGGGPGGGGGAAPGGFGEWFEEMRRRAEQAAGQQQQRGATGGGPSGGGGAAPGGFGEWFEEMRRRAEQAAGQQQQRNRTYQGSYGSQQQQQRAQYRPPSSGPAGDPLGYYSRLGLKPGATKEDIQAAFRGLAMKHHPDMVTDPAQKKKATAEFQKLVEAYTVLRDGKFLIIALFDAIIDQHHIIAKKRRNYDTTGRE
ncbi:hypothetical protein DFS34DRAFT_597815 [Phlyctochytrium arcticum]|nr:hypothetical protein DFS34DRAFT_597815 [Phlyctochytrium arcticum]